MSPRVSSPSARPGLTLLEVLAATTLLAVITAACLPLLAEARRYADTVQTRDRFETLVVIADAVMSDPESFGLDQEAMALDGFEAVVERPGSEQTSIPIPMFAQDELLREPIVVRLLSRAIVIDDPDESHRHGWLEFRLGDDVTLRYIELPDPHETEEASR
jgi:prepilin-type N-terminal cleavage/methylation domain-containing protein